MKVLVFTSLYPNSVWPHHGVFVKERMTHVARLDGCRIKVMAPVPYFPPVKITHRWCFSQVPHQEIIDGVEVLHPRYVMIPKIGMALHGLLMFLSVLPIAKRLQQDFGFDLIDTHYVYPDGFAAVLLGAFFNKPVVVSARGTDINLFKEFPLIRRLLEFTLGRADRVIAVSGALQRAMFHLKVPEAKISVIPNGVDLTKFYPFPQDEARRRLGLPHTRVLLSVGHLTSNKGFDLLIKALKLLFEEFHESNLHLVIVGAGEIRQALEHLISSLNLNVHVHLAGDVPHHELYLWYSAADLFCLASSREGWPNVLMEALACGTPVVATAVGGIPEIICSDNIGLLTNRTERDIAAAIALALKTPWHPHALRGYASKHNWDEVALSVLRTFEAALDGKGNHSRRHARSCQAAANSHLPK